MKGKLFITLGLIYFSLFTQAQTFAGGYEHSLFICKDGTVEATGYNFYGQLGDGTSTNRSSPVQVSGLTGIIAVAAGYNHSVFVKNDGTVWATGYNRDGELGDGTTTNKYLPSQGSITNVHTVAAGATHTLYLKNDGTVWASGKNSFGELGDGSTTERDIPTQINSLSGVVAIAAGYYHSLFVKNDGTVWACGSNSNGQLGDGTILDRSIPVQVTSLSGIIKVAGGYKYSVFLKSDGFAYTCGYNNLAQLGIANFTDYHTPVNPTLGVIDIAAGQSHTLFLKNDGMVWGCGATGNGQLAVLNASTSSPTKLGFPYYMTNMVRLSAGGKHSLFLKDNDSLFVAGWNGSGQLGVGTFDTQVHNIPSPPHNVCQIVTALETVEADLYLTIYPNPIQSILTIHCSTQVSEEFISVSILNVLGEIIQEEKMKWQGDLSINLKPLSTGIYFVVIKSNRSTIVRKVIKE